MALVERLFGQVGRTLVAVAIMERRKSGRCGGLAVAERWQLVEVRLYLDVSELQ